MRLVAPETITFTQSGFCPGCGHGLAVRLIAEVMEEMGLSEKLLAIVDVACGSLNIDYWRFDTIMAAHGRPIATAVGVKKIRPENPVMAYIGDGAAYSIGMAETMHTAIRNDNVVTIVINNSLYGMTGGQMAPTTLVGMKASTAPKGRIPEEHGYPMHMCEILDKLTAPAYLVRTSCNTPQNVIKTKNAIKKAFQNQIDGKGFSMVEIVTSCPTNWGLEPLDALDFIEQKMLPEYPLGVIRDK